MKRLTFAILVLSIPALACGSGGPPTPFLTPEQSVFDSGRTAYGFFPSPPEASLTSILNHYKSLGDHADFVLMQQNIAWGEFAESVEGESPKRTDLRNQMTLARQNGLEMIFVVDPLNGLNRREFFGLPAGWEASFADPSVRAALANFALWIVREFRPRYLGLASEINTYADAHPDDFPNYVSLYHEVYSQVKAEAPETQVFATFQWEDQIGERLTFWVYLLLNDFDLDSYAKAMREQGLDEDDINALGMFAAVGLRESDGTPKPALEVWDSFRGTKRSVDPHPRPLSRRVLPVSAQLRGVHDGRENWGVRA